MFRNIEFLQYPHAFRAFVLRFCVQRRIHRQPSNQVMTSDMSSLFIEYPKCTTCQKAKKWLDEQGISYEDRHIVEQNPTAEELRSWIEGSGLPAKKFFNTSGLLYKSMKLKDQLAHMSLDEQIALLASNGMLVKRPIFITNGKICVGFKADEWKAAHRS